MRTSIREEFKQRAIDYVNDGVLTNDNKEQWHFYLFNEDYYIIYHYRAERWLKKHDVSPLEAIRIIQEYQEENYGETDLDYSSAEDVVNMLAYVLGEEWMQEDGEDFIQNYIN
tara:strand:+ start:108 stop:446 length:339 start_codon:yes stop_codon:yes gene_type:complete